MLLQIKKNKKEYSAFIEINVLKSTFYYYTFNTNE